MNPLRLSGLAALLLAAALAVLPSTAAEPAKKVGPDPKEWNRVVDKAVEYLKEHQGPDGAWSEDKSPGVTGIALTGMLQTGKVTAKDPAAEKGLKYIESLINRD